MNTKEPEEKLYTPEKILARVIDNLTVIIRDSRAEMDALQGKIALAERTLENIAYMQKCVVE